MLQQQKKLEQRQFDERYRRIDQNPCTGSLLFISLPLLSADIQKTHTASAEIYSVAVMQFFPCFRNRRPIYPDTALGKDIENTPQAFIGALEHCMNRADPFAEQTKIRRASAPEQTFPVMHGHVLFADTQVSPGFRLCFSTEQRPQVPDQNDDRQKQNRIFGNAENIVCKNCRPPLF